MKRRIYGYYYFYRTLDEIGYFISKLPMNNFEGIVARSVFEKYRFNPEYDIHVLTFEELLGKEKYISINIEDRIGN